MTKSLRDVIAAAIKAADSSYFFEDYTFQADAVLHALRRAGYHLINEEPDEAMVKAGKSAISMGYNKPSELVTEVYKKMVKAAER